jgi:trk system potassium uptake protein TrkH
MIRVSGRVNRYPARALLIWYTGLIVAGTGLLRLPWAAEDNVQPISWSDAAFTATSAACVTGLIVRDTPRDFSGFGEAVILVLIQLGGIGIMTVTTLVMLQLGGRFGLRERAVMNDTLGMGDVKDIRPVLKRVLGVTVVSELIGTALLFSRFAFDMPLGQALWQALFHSISAYCNAGFSLRSDNLMSFRDDPLVNLTIISLIVVGGLGVPVVNDLFRWFGPRVKRLRDRRRVKVGPTRELRLHTKLTLAVSGVLLIGGAAMVALLESDGALRDLPWTGRLLVPLQHSASCRTAGFNSIDLNQFGIETLFISIALMIIGGGSCSTAGGMKVTTVGLLVTHAWSRLRGRRHLNLYRRTIPGETIERAFAITVLFGVIAFVLLGLLLVVDGRNYQAENSPTPFLSALFEVCSALGTVGLSLGLTTQLSGLGRCIIMIAMMIGRLGPFAVFAATAAAERTRQVEYAAEGPLLG